MGLSAAACWPSVIDMIHALGPGRPNAHPQAIFLPANLPILHACAGPGARGIAVTNDRQTP